MNVSKQQYGELTERYCSECPTIGEAHGPLGLIGIGGSFLGPQSVSQALRQSLEERLGVFSFDNSDSMLEGDRICDEISMNENVTVNPSLLFDLALFCLGNDIGVNNVVALLCRDRQALSSEYPQQLLMEFLGKAKDLNGRLVHYGIRVVGNKGSTNQHSYIQQLSDGLNDFFVTFVGVRRKHCSLDHNDFRTEPILGWLAEAPNVCFSKKV